MVSKKEAILNLFETKGSREVWLDRFAGSNMNIDTFFVEVEAATEPVIQKFQIIDDEPCYEKEPEKITVKLGKATIEVPATVGKLQLQTILRAVVEL